MVQALGHRIVEHFWPGVNWLTERLHIPKCPVVHRGRDQGDKPCSTQYKLFIKPNVIHVSNLTFTELKIGPSKSENIKSNHPVYEVRNLELLKASLKTWARQPSLDGCLISCRVD